MTSWVVSSISVWLVPVYIGAMVLIFAVPRTNRPKPAREDESGESSSGENPSASSSVEVEVEALANVNETPPAPAAEAEAPPEAAPPKPRKRRVRAKKTAKGAAAPDDALASGRVTWVRVGPGKFVRSVVPVAEFVGPPAPASIAVAEPQPSSESPSAPDDPPPAPEPGPDGEPCQEPLMDQDDPARVEEAPEGPVLSDSSEAADVEANGFAIEHEHESESTSPDVSEAIAEEHGNAPSTLGEDSEIVPNPEADQDEEPSPAVASLPAAEAVVDVEVESREMAETRAPERSTPVGLVDSPTMEAPGRRARLGLFFSASLRRPRRTAEPAAVAPSRRLGNVRRSGETRVRQFATDVRGRRANVQRDFHPRSPPARS